VPEFQVDDRGFSLVNAWWLSNAAHLAYYDSDRLEPELGRLGWRILAFFSGESTQAFLAACDTVALLAFRGTEAGQLNDLKVDVDIRLVTFEGEAKVHRGFLAGLDQVWSDVAVQLERLAAQGLPVWYTGHSLGAALATLAAARRPPAATFTFGSPRVGNLALVQRLAGMPVYRLVNCCDVAATVPGRPLGYRHVGEQWFITSRAELVLNPSFFRLLWEKVLGIGRHALAVPWLRRDVVRTRPLADHIVVNYTAGLAQAIERAAGE
jgi:pimeloyl-ACP methyl ester carboxylesterase